MKTKFFTLILALAAVMAANAKKVTFDFTNPEALGIATPAASSGTDLTDSVVVSDDVTISFTSGSPHTRIWNSGGNCTLRVYKNGGSMTFTAADNITGVELAGSSISFNEFEGKSWKVENPALSVTLTAKTNNTITSITLTIGETPDIWQPDTIGVSEANALIAAGDAYDHYVKGVLTGAPFSSYSDFNGAITFWMSDIENPSDSIQFYLCKAIGNVKWNSLAEAQETLHEGDTVLVHGAQLTTYTNSAGTITEIYGGYLVQIIGANPNPAVVKYTELSVAEAIEVAQALTPERGGLATTMEMYSVKGYVTGIKNAELQSYYLADEQGAYSEFVAFKCATIDTEVNVGDFVKVTGEIMHYWVTSSDAPDDESQDYHIYELSRGNLVHVDVPQEPSYSIHLYASDPEQGSVRTSDWYPHSDTTFNARYADTVNIEAIPNEGYQFVSWSDGNTENPRTFYVESDLTLAAMFESRPIGTVYNFAGIRIEHIFVDASGEKSMYTMHAGTENEQIIPSVNYTSTVGEWMYVYISGMSSFAIHYKYGNADKDGHRDNILKFAGEYMQADGKNVILTFTDVTPGDSIKLWVSAKGSTDATFSPLAGAEGFEQTVTKIDNVEDYVVVSFVALSDYVQIKETTGGFRIRKAVVGYEPEEEPTPCPMASGTCGENLTWELGCDGVLTISGTGAMEDFESMQPWYENKDYIRTVIIENGVTYIGTDAFYICDSLTSVEIPSSVTSIGRNVFKTCSAITSINVDSTNSTYCSIDGVLFNKDRTILIQHPRGRAGSYTIPNSVTSLGEGAFYGCYRLTSVTIPNSVTSIPTKAFYYCNNLTSINIPDSVTSIGKDAFYGCSRLTSIEIPNGVTSIGESAFLDCRVLTTIDIPSSVTSIGEDAFCKCASLTAFNVSTSNPYYCSIDGILFTKDTTILVKWPDSKQGVYTIPNGVTRIESGAFVCCRGLTSIEIPSSVTSIGNEAFNGCSGLTYITCKAVIPPTLGEKAFGEENHYIPLYVPADSIELYRAARGWKNFTNIQPIQEELEPVYPIIVHVYDSIVGEYVNDAVIYMDQDTALFEDYDYEYGYWEHMVYAHRMARNRWILMARNTHRYYVRYWLTPDYVPSDTLFQSLHDTTDVTLVVSPRSYRVHLQSNNSNQGLVRASNWYPHSDTTFNAWYADTINIEAIPHEGYRFTRWSDGNTDNPRTIRVTHNMTLEAIFRSVSTGNRVYDFSGIRIEDIYVDAQGGTYMYTMNAGTENEQIIPSVNYTSTVGEWMNVSIFGMGSFAIQYKNSNPKENVLRFAADYMQANSKNFILTFTDVTPGDSIKLWVSAKGSSDATFSPLAGAEGFEQTVTKIDNVEDYVVVSFVALSDYVQIKETTGGFRIRKAVVGYEPEEEPTPCPMASGTCGAQGDNLTWELGCDSVLTISGYGEMADWNQYAYPWNEYKSIIKSVLISDSVTHIGRNAFYDFAALTTVSLPESVASIGEGAFEGCTSLPVVDNLRYVGTYLVEAADKTLSTYAIREGTKWIGSHAFSECAMTSINIPNSVTEIQGAAFYRCSSLTSIVLPNGLTRIAHQTFLLCDSLQSVIIPDGVTEIDYEAFEDCRSLESIVIPDSVVYIWYGAFAGCRSLTSITIPSSVLEFSYNPRHKDAPAAFAGCTELTAINVSPYNPNYCSIDGVVFTKDAKTLIQYPGGKQGAYTIPDGVRVIDEWSFNECFGLTSVTIPNSVRTMKDFAFSYCYALSSVTIPNSIDTLGYGVFESCSGLTSITCEAVELPSMDGHVFDGVDKSIPLYVPAESIEYYRAANQWKNFTNILPIPSVQYTISVAVNDSNYGTAYGSGTFAEDSTVLIWATPNYGYHFVRWSDGSRTNPRRIEVTQDSTFIAYFAVDRIGYCGDSLALIWEYDATAKALTISGNGALNSNYTFGAEAPTAVENLIIAEGVTAIGQNAFANYATIKHISVPTTVARIHSQAFYDCVGLEEIYSYRETPCVAYSNTFDGIDKFSCTLHVLSASVSKYQIATGWRDFPNIQTIDAQTVTEVIEEVETVPADNNVTITWPVSEGADTYTIEVSKNGVVVCRLIFDANGQLLGIAFVPGRRGGAQAPAAVKTENGGLRFTITGLESGTDYQVTVIAKDENEEVVEEYTSDFTTSGAEEDTPTGLDAIDATNQATKLLRNGQIFILRGDKVYTLQGQEVR